MKYFQISGDAKQVCSVVVGHVYKHYKGNKYRVLMIVFNSETDDLQPWVVYQGLYVDPRLGNEPIFTRSVAAFMENIDLHGSQVRRFTLID
jgi:hypothetical protein